MSLPARTLFIPEYMYVYWLRIKIKSKKSWGLKNIAPGDLPEGA